MFRVIEKRKIDRMDIIIVYRSSVIFGAFVRVEWQVHGRQRWEGLGVVVQGLVKGGGGLRKYNR